VLVVGTRKLHTELLAESVRKVCRVSTGTWPAALVTCGPLLREQGLCAVVADVTNVASGGAGELRMFVATFPSCPVIAIVSREETLAVRSLVELPVAGLVAGDDQPADLVRAVAAVLAGRAWLSPELSAMVVALTNGRGGSSRERLRVSLSPRQREIVELFRSGVSRGDIARKLNVSPFTVDFHRRQIERKLGRGWRGTRGA